MAGFFGFGAFSTSIGQMIEQATDNAASAGNLAYHLQICDAINDSDNGPKDAVAAIRKRLTGSNKNFHMINLTLTVLETCMKNCTIRFHSKVCQREFLKDLMSVLHAKNNPPTIVRERVLGLIQYWADSFKSKPQLIAVVELYDQLRDEGIEFPPVDLDSMAPVNTPEQRAAAAQAQAQQPPASSGLQIVQPAAQTASRPQHRNRNPIGPLKPEQIAKLLSELDVVRRNLDVMNELLVENDPGKESADDLQLMKELHQTTESMQERVTGLIGRVTDEIVLESLLQINDELNQSFTRYNRHMKNRQAMVEGQQPPTAPEEAPPVQQDPPSLDPPSSEPPAISYPSLDDPPAYTAEPVVGQLIDLGIELTALPKRPEEEPPSQAPPQPLPPPPQGDIVQQLATMGITGGSSTTTPSAQPQAPAAAQLVQSDEFDMFSQSRMAYSNSNWSSTYDDNKQQQDHSSLAAVVHHQPQQPATQEGTYLNIDEFLNVPSPEPSGVQPVDDQATSAEFDQFLAQRAAKNRPRPQMQRVTKEDTTEELFQL